MKRLLIFGSRGFIGSKVHSHFLSQPGVDTWGADVVPDYAASRYFLVDVVNVDYEAIFRAQTFDACINCAGAASVQDSIVHPARDYYLNANHVFNLVEAIRLHSPSCRFLNLSSAAVYGNPIQLPVNESHPAQPVSPYGWHKYQSELISREFYQIYGIRTCSARIFSAFGPGLRKQLFWDWYKRAQGQSPMTVHGSGNESRDFIFIDDVTQALHCILDGSDFKGECINVGNGEEICINQALEVFRESCGFHFEYNFDNKVRPGDPLNWKADISILSSMGYKKRVRFEDGIKKYLTWVREGG